MALAAHDSLGTVEKTHQTNLESMPSTVKILLALTIVIVLLHVHAHLTPCEGVQILQATLSQCTPALFAEKRPIVITDRVVNHADVWEKTAIRYQHVWSGTQVEVVPGKRSRAIARHTLLFIDDVKGDVKGYVKGYAIGSALIGNTTVDISHPKHPNDVVRVVLSGGRTLVLPPMWYYQVTGSGGKVMKVSLI